MRNLVLIIALLGLGASINLVTGQAQPVKRCIGFKANGEPCKSTFVLKSGFCRAHDLSTPKCGVLTAKGQPCKMAVKAAGMHCRFHQ